jgi:hypothetical protein
MNLKIVALIPVAALAFIVGCGGGETPEAKAPDEAAAAPEEAAPAEAAPAEGEAAPAEGAAPAEAPAEAPAP